MSKNITPVPNPRTRGYDLLRRIFNGRSEDAFVPLCFLRTNTWKHIKCALQFSIVSSQSSVIDTGGASNADDEKSDPSTASPRLLNRNSDTERSGFPATANSMEEAMDGASPCTYPTSSVLLLSHHGSITRCMWFAHTHHNRGCISTKYLTNRDSVPLAYLSLQ